MSSQVFVNGVTLTDAGWFNDVNTVTYTGLTTQILVGGGTGVTGVWTTATGSGSPVRANTPTLITPVLGVATGTSLALTGTSPITISGSTVAMGQQAVTQHYMPSLTDGCRGYMRAGMDWWSRNQQWGGPFGFMGLLDAATDTVYNGEAATGNIQQDGTQYPFGNAAGTTWEAQGFKLAESQTTSAIWMKMWKVGDPTANASIFIYSDNGSGKPNALVATGTAQSGKLHTSDTNGAWYRFVLSQALIGGTQYHITMKSSAAVDGSNYWGVACTNSNKYPYGYLNQGDGTPTWTSFTGIALCFLVELSATAQTLQASGLFDGKLQFGGSGASGTLTMSRGLANSVPLREILDVTNHTFYQVWNALPASLTFVDYGYGEDHDRVVLYTNASGYPVIKVYDSAGTATTVTSAVDCTSGYHSIGWLVTGTVVKLYVDGSTYTSGAVTISFDKNFANLGTMYWGGGFAIAPTWSGSSIGINGFSGLPSTLGWTYTGGAGWATESSAFSVSGGKLFQNKNGFGSTDIGYYLKATAGLSNANGWAGAWKARYSGTANLIGYGEAITVLADASMRQYTTHHEYFARGTAGRAYQTDNKSVENTYQQIGKLSDYFVFRNRKLVEDGSGQLVTAAAGAQTNAVMFGDNENTAGANADVTYSYMNYYTTAWNPPQFTTGSLHESICFQGDQSALWPILYNGGTRLSAKSVLGLPRNYTDLSSKIPAVVQRGISTSPTTTSTTYVLLTDMETFNICDSASLGHTSTTYNNTAGTGNTTIAFSVDGVTQVMDELYLDTPTGGGAAPFGGETVKGPYYLGLHKFSIQWHCGAAGTSINNTIRRTLSVEPKL